MMQAFSKPVVIVGDAPDADVVLPCARTVLDAFGDHAVADDFVVRFEEAETPWATRSRVRTHARSMFASFAAHVAILALAFFFASRVDPKEREAERIDALRGYVARLTEQPTEPTPHVDVIDTTLEEKRDAPGTIAHPVAPLRASPSKASASASRGGGSGRASGGSSCAAFASSAHDPSSTWIEFVLEDERGRPVVGEPYRVTLPDGTVREGKTDKRGLVCFTGIKPGDAQIEWPRSGDAVVYTGEMPKPI